MAIEKLAVIGAGLMGSGIAAHIANAGHDVVLLDLVPAGARNRTVLAEAAVERLLKSDPAPFMDKRFAKRIRCGNLEDDFKLLGEADWIIEAVIERLDAKQALYRMIDGARKPGSIVSSNTSTIPLATLLNGLPERFARDFLITHFFNPPRYMRLLELVQGPLTRADAASAARDFCDYKLGKGVIAAKDTPGFIANRIGTFWIQSATNEAIEGGITVEEADAVLSRPFGIPKTGVFGLMDLVGLDLMPLVGKSLYEAVPAADGFRSIYREHALFGRLIADGYTGRKGKGGFYRLDTEAGKKEKQVLDLGTGRYTPAQRPRLESIEATKGDLKALLSYPDYTGRYAWRVMSRTLGYAVGLLPEIADDVFAVDEAMRLGYAWKNGPFALIDEAGAGWFAERLAADGITPPPLLKRAAEAGGFYRIENGRRHYMTTEGRHRAIERAPGVLLLGDLKLSQKPLLRNGSASLWDIGDGVACFEMHTKMNTFDPEVFTLFAETIALGGKNFRALVIYNEGDNFSAGVNLGMVLFAVNLAAWPMIEASIRQGQTAFSALKFTPFPVVGAPSGLALGGGCEILLHCDGIEAHAESYIGLVEVGVGLIPGWGGCKEMVLRGLGQKRGFGGAMPVISKVFETIGMAKVARSAYEAKELGFLREGDGITANRDRLLMAAKRRALALIDGYKPPEPANIKLPGKTARVALGLAVKGLALAGKATAHDQTVATELAFVLSGGTTDQTAGISEEQLSALEREAMLRLMHDEKTLARMEHILDTGKPLRN